MNAKRIECLYGTIPAALCIAALWPVWRWLFAHYRIPGASPLPPLMLALALGGWGIRYRSTPPAHRSPSPPLLYLSGLFLLGCALAQGRMPGVIRAELGLAALACAMLAALPPAVRRHSWGLPPMLLLAAPLGPALDFFLGYPLRRVVAQLVSFVSFHAIHAEGAGLSDGITTVYVDAPCSGLRMLTVGIALSAAGAWYFRLKIGSTLGTLAAALLIVLFANAARARILFQLGAAAGPDTTLHAAVGITVFAGAAIAILLVAATFRKDADSRAALDTAETPRKSWFLFSLYAVTAFITALLPILPAGAPPLSTAAYATVPWPVQWSGIPLVPIPPSPLDLEFREGLPGAAAQFRLGDSATLVLLRQCPEPTHALHSAEHCYTATGWRCHPETTLADAGHTWSRFRAQRAGGESRTVRQAYFRIENTASLTTDLAQWIADAPSWPDVSSWYWATASDANEAAWTLAITVAE